MALLLGCAPVTQQISTPISGPSNVPALIIRGPIVLPYPTIAPYDCQIATKAADGSIHPVALSWCPTRVEFIFDGKPAWDSNLECQDHGPWMIAHRFYDPGKHSVTCKVYDVDGLAGETTLMLDINEPGPSA